MMHLLKRDMNKLPRIGITMGDPAVIGQEIAIKTLMDSSLLLHCKHILVGEASRLFLGNAYEKGAERIASHYAIPPDFYKAIRFDHRLSALAKECLLSKECSSFEAVELMEVASPDLAYNILIALLVIKQIESIDLILKHQDAKNIFVDGGFSKNHVFMSMLASYYHNKKVYAAEVAQATALGAALAIHDAWNPNPVGDYLINLKLYS